MAWGPFGVALFFLISGFVIPYTFTKRSASAFLVGRAFRIFPLYMAGFSVTLLAVWLSGAIDERPFPYALSHVLIHYVPGLRDLLWQQPIDWIVWTLEIELKFYLVCALVAPLLRKASLLTFLARLALFVVVSAWSRHPFGELKRTIAYSSEYMIFMFIGVAFNFYFRGRLRAPTLAVMSAVLLGLTWRSMVLETEPSLTMLSYAEAFIVLPYQPPPPTGGATFRSCPSSQTSATRSMWSTVCLATPSWLT